jgi:hypothetical protein
MTAGQIATPYRQSRTPLFVAAVIIAFGIGLVTGLVGPRTIGQGAQAAATVGAVAAPAGARSVGVAGALDLGTQDFRGARDLGAANHPAAAATLPVAVSADDSRDFRGARDFQAAQDHQPATRFGGP